MTLRLRLTLALAALLTIVSIAAVAFSFREATEEAEAFLDRQQRQVARFVGDLPFVASDTAGVPGVETEDNYVVTVRYRDGRELRSSHPETGLPQVDATGFTNFTNAVGEWRLFTLVLPERTIQVAQQMEVRSEIAVDSALNAALPFLFAVPLIWLVIGVVTRIAFRPLGDTARSVELRQPTDTTPIDPARVPPEVRPLVEAINGLLARLNLALQQQKQFVAEAAHALRTPLAALTLQIDNLRNVTSDRHALERLDEVKDGARRTSDLAHKLLVLARADAGSATGSGTARLDEVVTQAIADLAPLAAERRIDLGLSQSAPVEIGVSAHDLRVLADILIDNAVRYTPPSGIIDVTVACTEHGAELSVSDTGPGLPESAIPRVFERFYRAHGAEIEGSGLGLAIARSITDKYGDTIELRNRTDRSGLIALVRFERPIT